MDKKLLEHIIRKTICEFLDYLKVDITEVEDTIGAPSPPAGGLGTADTPALEPASSPPPSENIKGLYIVYPKQPSKLIKVNNIKYSGDEQQLIKGLRILLRNVIGVNNIQISLDAIRKVKDWTSNQNSALFLYISRSDIEGTTRGLMLYADRNLQNARSNSIPAAEAINLYNGTTYVQNTYPTTHFPPLAEVSSVKVLIKKIIMEELKNIQ